MPVTLKDIARDLGVSVVTVSKVLRNHQDIGEETRRRVLQRVKEVNYTPNLAARGLVTGKTYLVGLVVPDLLHPFFAQIAVSLSAALRKRGYYLTITTSEDNAELEEQEIVRLLGRRLDALVIASSCAEPAIFERLLKVGRLATGHLIDVGCKRIAHLRGPENSPGKGRLKGYEESLHAHGLIAQPGYVSSQRRVDVQSRESGAELMKQMLALSPHPDGVFCYNDPMAIGAIHAILEAGLRIPEDVAVIGSGNLHYDTELRVPLSSIDQRTELIGERAAKLALSLMESKTQPRAKTVIVQPELVARASTARAR
jgi:LacI family transcriptional regulator